MALDHQRIAVSLRRPDAAPIARAIPAPTDHAARLRAIAWLAGNLARDQVSPLVAEPLDAPPGSEAAPAPSAGAAPSPPPPSSALAPADAEASVAPPPFETPAATTVAHAAPQPPRPASWSIGATTGPSISLYGLGHALRQSIFGSWTLKDSLYDVFRDDSAIWRVELRHRAEGSRLFSGIALEGSANDEAEIIGATGFVGSTLSLGHFRLEANVGAGIDLGERLHVVNEDLDGEPVTNQYTTLRPGLYAAGSLAVAHPVFDSLDAALSLDAHASVVDEYDGYLAVMIGLRYRL
ncbi:MAG TPA: hypothetical protein VHO06_10620 [Polyangia bacterium]|nr:hypothetical protein [Polyangia bacterium]